MLTDIERKVLRVIGNYSAGRKRFPTIDELCIKTGRSRKGIIEVLEVLHKETYIVWTKGKPNEMELLEAWERKDIWKKPIHTEWEVWPPVPADQAKE